MRCGIDLVSAVVKGSSPEGAGAYFKINEKLINLYKTSEKMVKPQMRELRFIYSSGYVQVSAFSGRYS